MRCARIGRWSGAYLPPRNPRIPSRIPGPQNHNERVQPCEARARPQCVHQWRSFHAGPLRRDEGDTGTLNTTVAQSSPKPSKPKTRSPRKSAKLAATHARLSLPPRLTQAALARCLTHASADTNPELNNASLATLGQELIAYYTAEWLICNYPRLPMPVIFAAQYAYCGDKTLSLMRHEWGIEAADAPGEEVDPGYLQFKRVTPGNAMAPDMIHRVKELNEKKHPTGTGRSNEAFPHIRRGISSRIVYDDEFGELRSGVEVHDTALDLDTDLTASLQTDSPSTPNSLADGVTLEAASASFVRAVFGALYLFAGSSALQSFHEAHILSRHLPLHTLFNFRNPLRDLAVLCDREGFEPPVARLISETGRKSRTPVYVVGVYSGRDKLGEDAGSSLNEGRVRAAAQALRSWYLYTPPADEVCLPSRIGDMQRSGKRWIPQMVDPGEIVT